MARKLSADVYKLTQKFPEQEKYAFVSQMRRAAVSIAANIAEGTSRTSMKDQAHFTTMAYGSLMELFNHLVISRDLEYNSEDELNGFRQKVQSLSVKLSNLKTSQLRKIL